ncbi:MAG: creatininase family protein [Candidatus Bathyarchaeia archaeon]
MPENRLMMLNGYEFREQEFSKAVLPLGSTEYHGGHLPYGSDSLISTHLARELADRVEGMLVLPTLFYGMSQHYASFPIALSLSSDTLMSVLQDIFLSLNRHDINRLLIINGHDGNISPIDSASREFRESHPEMKIAVLEAWWETAGKLLPEDTFDVWNGLGHAGEGETSINLAINPELVDMSKARGVVPDLPENVEIKWRFEELTPYGVTGDPTKATAEKGRKMRGKLLEALVTFVNEMDKRSWRTI